MNQEENNDRSKNQKLSFIHIITSVFAAAFGVQKQKNLEKDFSNKNSFFIYIAAGVIFAALFVVVVAVVVKIVLKQAGV